MPRRFLLPTDPPVALAKPAVVQRQTMAEMKAEGDVAVPAALVGEPDGQGLRVAGQARVAGRPSKALQQSKRRAAAAARAAKQAGIGEGESLLLLARPLPFH